MTLAYDVVLVGAGPRGLIVLQQLAVAQEQRMSANPELAPLRVLVADPARPGSGRVWDPAQPADLLMNGTASATSIYPLAAGIAEGPERLASGPTLEQWLQDAPPASESSLVDGYAPRRLFGAYLDAAFARLRTETTALSITVSAVEVRAVERDQDAWRVLLSSVEEQGGRAPGSAHAPVVVLATGHVDAEPTPAQQRRHEHARVLNDADAGRTRNPFPASYSAATLDAASIADAVPAGDATYLEGLGLGFFDTVTLLTLGRGGQYESGSDGRLRYTASGTEPRLFAGSRKGLPFLGRSRLFRPLPVQDAQIDDVFSAARGRDDVQFDAELWPMIDRALRTVVTEASDRLVDLGIPEELAARTRQWCALPFDRWALASSLEGIYPQQDIHARTLAFLEDQCALEQASLATGVLVDPRQAAGALLAPLRNRLRGIVPGIRLTGTSYRDELSARFTPLSSFIGTGPPLARIEQLAALARSGVIRLLGSAVVEETADGFLVRSQDAPTPPVTVRHLIEARQPEVSSDATASPLLQSILRDGIAAVHTRQGISLHGLSVSVPQGRVRGADGTSRHGLFAFGIPTEGTYWNTSAGPISDAEHPIFTTARDLALAAIDDAAHPSSLSLTPTVPAPGAA